MTWQQLIKRCADLLIAISALIILFPILAITAVLIATYDGTPIFYISHRFVRADKSIKIFKFRSMVKDAKSEKYNLSGRYMRNGYLDIPITCEAYTPVGRWIERLQLVEVPQFLNIIFHGMSLIGNRPLPGENISLLKAHNGWKDRFLSPAGITGIAQVVGKLNMTSDQRLALEVLYSKVYQKGKIIKCDVYIVWYTVRLIVFGRGLPYDRARNLLDSCMRP